MIGIQKQPSSRDVIIDVAELFNFIGEKMYIIIHEDEIGLSIAACKDLKTATYKIARGHVFPESIDIDTVMILSVEIMDQLSLPYEIPNDKEVFIIYDGWQLTRHQSVAEAVEDIEFMLRCYDYTKIDDFLVMIGEEICDESTIVEFLDDLKFYQSLFN